LPSALEAEQAGQAAAAPVNGSAVAEAPAAEVNDVKANEKVDTKADAKSKAADQADAKSKAADQAEAKADATSEAKVDDQAEAKADEKSDAPQAEAAEPQRSAAGLPVRKPRATGITEYREFEDAPSTAQEAAPDSSGAKSDAPAAKGGRLSWLPGRAKAAAEAAGAGAEKAENEPVLNEQQAAKGGQKNVGGEGAPKLTGTDPTAKKQ
jgi:hypothetical protein